MRDPAKLISNNNPPHKETPMNDSERELLKAWLEAAGADGPDIYYRAREHKKFLRVLREVKASAWGEGYIDGCLDAQDDTPFATTNPYEED